MGKAEVYCRYFERDLGLKFRRTTLTGCSPFLWLKVLMYSNQ